uniref:Erythrocyte membrane protein band 4.2 n=1 Tax=Falco tinnunculus TaxID=100819 RepID=A0A8C4XKK4_FALTI
GAEEVSLRIRKCDFKITMNNNNHHTEEISTERLMVRRGQPFTITVVFSAPIFKYLQLLKKTFLTVQTVSHPSKADGIQTKFDISVLLKDQKQWSAALEEQDPFFWTISVNSPVNAPIGQYTLLLRASKSSHLLGNFTLLFNPWCRDDEVFLPNEAQRQEYILNQEGLIYGGTENAVLAQPWDFSQEDIVDICFTLLDVGERHQQDKNRTQRKNPIYICRIVAAMMNCDEFRGILAECGTRQYYDGTPPSKWLGSSPILRQWAASQCKPVRYGQCWVFAAVMCSVLRCLGIPTRVVTGFTWAHNTSSCLSVDEYYDEDGTLLTQDKSTRVWTFHVWNECWMARADLLPKYSGWQALDATCQEKNRSLSFCGPAPVQAIKEGDIEVDYDVCYFFAAINAKCQVWIQTADGLKPVLGSTKYTGNNISTKSVGSERCEDITHNYKYPEGHALYLILLNYINQISRRPGLSSAGTFLSGNPSFLISVTCTLSTFTSHYSCNIYRCISDSSFRDCCAPRNYLNPFLKKQLPLQNLLLNAVSLIQPYHLILAYGVLSPWLQSLTREDRTVPYLQL